MAMALGRFCGDSTPYERISDAEQCPDGSVGLEDSRKSSISKRVMTFATASFAVLFVLAMTTASNEIGVKWETAGAALAGTEEGGSYSTGPMLGQPAGLPTGKKHHHHHHTIPTALRLVDDQTGLFVYALDNPLYDRLLGATSNAPAGYRNGNDDDPGKQQQGRNRRNLRAQVHRELPRLMLDRTSIQLRDPLVLSWTPGSTRHGHNVVTDDSVVALHCPPSNPMFHEAATIAQVRATHVHHGGDPSQKHKWFIPEFTIQRQEQCVFKLYDAKDMTQVLSESPRLTIEGAARTPTNIHMAFTSAPSEMLLQFVTGESGVPLVRYGTESTQLVHTAQGESLTYSSGDLCMGPANQTEPGKFLEPGQLHAVLARDLQVDTEYYYQVGLQPVGAIEDGVIWSNVHTFRSSLAIGDTTPFSYVVYGDQGCPSKGWGQGGVFVSNMAAREVRESPMMRSVHHFGDLSYAQGSGNAWDEWFNMIQPFSADVPLMVGVGNHEYDHTSGGENGKDPSGVTTPHGFEPMWGNFGDDSGGECGVPTAARFLMPQTEGSNGVFWYSHKHGLVHTIVISSEHDVSKGSVQYTWLEKNLKSVDRGMTPWVVVETHRPLYESEAAYDQEAVSIAMRFEVEDLLRDHQVDVVLGGHYHMYQRTCDGLYRSECNQGGPIHITIGSAGADLDSAPMIPQPWSALAIQQEFGYGRITVENSTALHWEFVKAGDGTDPETGTVRDDFWILRDR